MITRQEDGGKKVNKSQGEKAVALVCLFPSCIWPFKCILAATGSTAYNLRILYVVCMYALGLI